MLSRCWVNWRCWNTEFGTCVFGKWRIQYRSHIIVELMDNSKNEIWDELTKQTNAEDFEHFWRYKKTLQIVKTVNCKWKTVSWILAMPRLVLYTKWARQETSSQLPQRTLLGSSDPRHLLTPPNSPALPRTPCTPPYFCFTMDDMTVAGVWNQALFVRIIATRSSGAANGTCSPLPIAMDKMAKI